MIDTEGIPNWRVWTAKTDRGINRGYEQAYINECRHDHFVLINTSELTYDETCKVHVKPYTNGDWKPDWGTDASTVFEGALTEKDALLSEAEDCAREWMLDHPCTRDDGERDGVELLTDILNALRDDGIVPQHDTKVKGWIPSGHIDSTSHNIRPFVFNESEEELSGTDDPREADVLSFSISVDGEKSGLSYRETTKYDSDGESRRHHEPRNQDRLHGAIEEAFRSCGFTEEMTVKNGGYQTHWDYSTTYRVLAFIPDELDLELPEPQKRKRRARW